MIDCTSCWGDRVDSRSVSWKTVTESGSPESGSSEVEGVTSGDGLSGSESFTVKASSYANTHGVTPTHMVSR